MQWKNLGEHTVYENPWLSVNLADVELPDGRHLDHYLLRVHAAAIAAAVNDRDEVLLLWRHRFITDTWGWELPGGGIDEGERPDVAAARELLEETGWAAGPLHHLVTLEPSNGISDELHHVYWADGAEEVGHPVDGFESSRRAWVPLAEIPGLLAAGKIRSATTAAALLLLHATRPRPDSVGHPGDGPLGDVVGGCGTPRADL